MFLTLPLPKSENIALRDLLPDSPLNFEVRVEVDTLKKEVLHSVATAFANMVFPVPGHIKYVVIKSLLLPPVSRDSIFYRNTVNTLKTSFHYIDMRYLPKD